jgi:hypothetical protein
MTSQQSSGFNQRKEDIGIGERDMGCDSCLQTFGQLQLSSVIYVLNIVLRESSRL